MSAQRGGLTLRKTVQDPQRDDFDAIGQVSLRKQKVHEGPGPRSRHNEQRECRVTDHGAAREVRQSASIRCASESACIGYTVKHYEETTQVRVEGSTPGVHSVCLHVLHRDVPDREQEHPQAQVVQPAQKGKSEKT